MHSGVEDIFLNESQDNFEGHESSTKIPIGQILQRELQAGAGKKASFVSKGPCFQLQSTGSYSFPPKSTGKAKSLCLAGCKERPKDLLESVLWEIRPCKINHENQAGAENQCGPLLLCPCPVPSSIPDVWSQPRPLRAPVSFCSYVSCLCTSLDFPPQR